MECPVRLGLRVGDVAAAARFYGGLGFAEEATVEGPDGEPVVVILRHGPFQLVCDALTGVPFPDSDRERAIQAGPRGLGVVAGLKVDDLDAAYAYVTTHHCDITSEPNDEPWGERIFTCVDPFGYEWELITPLPGGGPEDAAAATRAEWFGER
jgi:uncharacterized glyoxalase superfamily protein PhnB